LGDGDIYWRLSKKASDKDLYIEVSENDNDYTGVLNLNKSGCVGIFDGSADLTDNEKLFVKGSGVKFENADGSASIIFDLYGQEIKTSNGDNLLVNYSNNNHTLIGTNALFVGNYGSITPRIGINTLTPTHTLAVFGFGVVGNLGAASLSTNVFTSVRSLNGTGYFGLVGNSLILGPRAYSSSENLYYSLSTKNLGLGTIYPTDKLHVNGGTSETISKFETSNTTAEVFQSNNGSGPSTWNTIYTFGRAYYSGPTLYLNSKKWGIGLFENGGSYSDAFVFRTGADTTTVNAIKASLSTDGDLDIKGSYTTNNDYAQGKFVQVYQTKLSSDNIYFNPFYPESNSNPSGIEPIGSQVIVYPFATCPFSGEIKSIQILSSDVKASEMTDPRFEISVITPSSGIDGFVSGFYVSPPSAPTDLSTSVSGIVSQFSLNNFSGNSLPYSYSNFSGSATFNSGQLLQYRICNSDGTSVDADFVVTSTIVHAIT